MRVRLLRLPRSRFGGLPYLPNESSPRERAADSPVEHSVSELRILRGAAHFLLPTCPLPLKVWELSLAVIAEGEGVDRQAGFGGGQTHRVRAEGRVLHKIIHARFLDFNVGTTL